MQWLGTLKHDLRAVGPGTGYKGGAFEITVVILGKENRDWPPNSSHEGLYVG